MQIEGGDLSLDLVYGRARVGAQEHDLTTMEVRSLAYLFEHPERWVSKQELLVNVWGYSRQAHSRTVATTINRLRQKLEPQPSAPRYLTSSPQGYRLELPKARSPALPLPYRDDPFVGRTRELGWLDDTYKSGRRAICVVGTGGIGKTRLAEEFATRQLARGRLVMFVDGTPCHGGAALIARLASGLDLEGAANLVLRVSRSLATRGIHLLVLDNVEQALAGLVPALEELLAQSGDLRLLVTSQQSLDMQAAARLELGPLEPIHADALFVERGYGHRDEPPPPPGDRDVRRLAEALEGIPLALELAAGWADLLTPDELFARVTAQQPIEDRDAGGGRHASLGRALAFAWTALTTAQRDALHQATVFVGGFVPAAAETVLRTGSEPVLGLLQQLRSRSLVHRDPGSRRLRVLLPIRELVRAREGPPPGDTALRHAAWYAEAGERLLDALDGNDPKGALHQLEAERGNLVAAATASIAAHDTGRAVALTRVVARHDFASGRSGPAAMLDELEALDLAPDDRATVLVCRTWTEEVSDPRWDRLIELAAEAMQLAEPGSLPWCEAAVQRAGGLLFAVRLAELTALVDDAAPLFDASAPPSLRVRLRSLGARAHSSSGDLAAAAHGLRACLAAAEQAGLEQLWAQLADHLSYPLALLGEHAEALALLNDAIARCEAYPQHLRLASLLHRRGPLLFNLGDMEAGMRDLRRAEELTRMLGAHRVLATVLWMLAWYSLDVAPHVQVQAHLDAARALRGSSHWDIELAQAAVQLDKGDAAGAVEILETTLAGPMFAEQSVYRAWLQLHLGLATAVAGDLPRARALAAEADAGLGPSGATHAALESAVLLALLGDETALDKVAAVEARAGRHAHEKAALARTAHERATPADAEVLRGAGDRSFKMRALLRLNPVK